MYVQLGVSTLFNDFKPSVLFSRLQFYNYTTCPLTTLCFIYNIFRIYRYLYFLRFLSIVFILFVRSLGCLKQRFLSQFIPSLPPVHTRPGRASLLNLLLSSGSPFTRRTPPRPNVPQKTSKDSFIIVSDRDANLKTGVFYYEFSSRSASRLYCTYMCVLVALDVTKTICNSADLIYQRVCVLLKEGGN